LRKKLLTGILYEIKKLGGLIKTMDKSHKEQPKQFIKSEKIYGI